MLRFKEYSILRDILVLNEISIDPSYRTKKGFFPYYILDDTSTSKVQSKLGNTAIKFKSVAIKGKKKKADWEKEIANITKGNLTTINDRGGFLFQVHTDKETKSKVRGQETEYKKFKKRGDWYILTSQKQAKEHDGVPSRKDATASANINEFLSMYFLGTEVTKTEMLTTWTKQMTKEKGAFWNNKKGTEGTGVWYGNEKKEVTYDALRELLKRDATAESDIKIGWNNAVAVKEDLKTNPSKIKTLFWTPTKKPGKIHERNPSDVVIEFESGSTDEKDRRFGGYSNKATKGKDATPKFNTNVMAFYEQYGDEKQVTAIEDIIDESLSYVTDTLWTNERKKNHKESWEAIKKYGKLVMTDDYTESGSLDHFRAIAKAFNKEKLNFYEEDFYHPYRNMFIAKFTEHLEKAENLAYFLSTISEYTWPTKKPGEHDCPYKLLVGTESSSTISEVSSDINKKTALSGNDKSKYTEINTTYDNKSQSFKLNFNVKLPTLSAKVEIPITARTRAKTKFSGKSLFIMTPGVILTYPKS